MRASALIAFVIMAVSAVVVIPEVTRGQNPFGGKGNKGPSMLLNADPAVLFEQFSRGRGFFLVSEMRSLKDPLTQYAQEKGISSGQITLQQFTDFHSQYRAKMGITGPIQPGGGMIFGKKGPGGGPPGMTPGAPPPSPDTLNTLADIDFKTRDRNGDGFLNPEEMPGQLKRDLARWDKNGDGLIDNAEYRTYFLASFAARVGGDQDANAVAKGTVSGIVDDDELDRKVTVLRAGKLPANMPAWFAQLDTDGDGQVALFEWRAGGKALDEFKKWDLNDDGFITPEEALKVQEVLAKDNPTKGNPFSSGTMARGGDPSGAGKGMWGKGPPSTDSGDQKGGKKKGGFGKKGNQTPP